jgi:hypothetical protein
MLGRLLHTHILLLWTSNGVVLCKQLYIFESL